MKNRNIFLGHFFGEELRDNIHASMEVMAVSSTKSTGLTVKSADITG